MALAKAAGFQAAVSNRYGVNQPGADPWQLHRIWIDATDNLTLFRAKVTGKLDLLRYLEGPAALRLRHTSNRRNRTD